jgi:hypothetical protein
MAVKKEKGEPKASIQGEAATETIKASEGKAAPAKGKTEEAPAPAPKPGNTGQMPDDRLDQIKESHELLKQFTAKELKILLNLKRNTSPKAWSVREDLVVLTLPKSNREIAELLQDRNKEAVKKRLQLLKSKGLTKRAPDGPPGKK